MPSTAASVVRAEAVAAAVVEVLRVELVTFGCTHPAFLGQHYGHRLVADQVLFAYYNAKHQLVEREVLNRFFQFSNPW